MAEFAIIGLGRFGRAVAASLAAEGQSVLAIDLDPARLERIADRVDSTVVADTTDENALGALRLERIECTVVAIGSRSTEASLLTTAILAQQRVPWVVARAFDHRHARLLRALGAHQVINPEDEIGHRLALRLAYPAIRDRIGEGETTIAEIEVPESFVGRSLAELDLPGRGVAVLGLLRDGRREAPPDPENVVASGDRLVLLGTAEALHRIADLL